MLGKSRPQPMIGKLSELLISGHLTGYLETIKSPRSPLELNMQSPKGLKNHNLGGVGLGILAALEKSGDGKGNGGEILAKYSIFSPSLNRSSPIPVNSGRNCTGRGFENLEMESLENYTYVTCHGPNNKSITKVYYDGDDINCIDGRNNFPVEGIPVYPTLDFLSTCHSCRKDLHGKDIFMYRGEKAFCSTDCRSKQIVMDERKEQCRMEASRSVEFSKSPYSRDHIFSTGIIAI